MRGFGKLPAVPPGVNDIVVSGSSGKEIYTINLLNVSLLDGKELSLELLFDYIA